MKRLTLNDRQGRSFHYLRLSLTEVCNFSCQYCLPHGYQKSSRDQSVLSVAEIRRLVSGFAHLGFWKLRLTGGEPTTRKDLLDIVREVSVIPGVTRIGMTTNGSRLPLLAPELFSAGVRALNVSVDSLDRKRFAEITGVDRLPEVLAGVEAALSCGFESIKVNTVLLNGMNEDSLEPFMEWVRDLPITVRFIELMQTQGNREFFNERHLSAGMLQLQLARKGWKMLPRDSFGGPAIEYAHSEYRGKIGLIAPYAKDFCDTCNRLRVSSQGGLRLCLFGEQDFSLRPYLQSDEQRDELVAAIGELIDRKPASHLLREGNYGNTRQFAEIGG